MKLSAFALAAGLASATVILFTDPADARRRYRDRGTDGYTTAESRFGHGSINGAVRGTNVGPQVQLPSGSWVYCRRSCSETLRVETVDRFENNGLPYGTSTLQAECGVFGCLDVR